MEHPQSAKMAEQPGCARVSDPAHLRPQVSSCSSIETNTKQRARTRLDVHDCRFETCGPVPVRGQETRAQQGGSVLSQPTSAHNFGIKPCMDSINRRSPMRQGTAQVSTYLSSGGRFCPANSNLVPSGLKRTLITHSGDGSSLTMDRSDAVQNVTGELYPPVTSIVPSDVQSTVYSSSAQAWTFFFCFPVCASHRKN